MTECPFCYRHCKLEEGQTGYCGGKICRDGKVVIRRTRLSGKALTLSGMNKKPSSAAGDQAGNRGESSV